MKIVVSAGPTREFIDPVRYLSNRSSGKMGYAVASALLLRGHEVVLVSGPVDLTPPDGVDIVRVLSAEDMLQAVLERFEWCDALVMAAAVADWRPEKSAESKLKKTGARLSVDFVRTTDILERIAPLKEGRILAGFAAETGDPVSEGMRKLKAKRLDVIFANDVSLSDAGFEADTNRIVCIDPSGRADRWPLMSKVDAGFRIAEVLEAIHVEGRA